MSSAGVVLIGESLGEPETKDMCDIFFAGRKNVDLVLLTRQGIYFKKGGKCFYCVVRLVADQGVF